MGLTGEALSGAGLDFGSSCRTTEQYPEALAAFEQGLARFPDTNEFKVFFAMVCYNLGRNKEGMKSLLAVLAETATDPALAPYRHAITLYAANQDRRG
ncbi:tetratricopeptide repeat protein [Aeromonas piscicola]|uniref:tetratricopeptide repeat protein n=1 Tax=Aeromonas piscicola TaxID=600645 RepID=UPI0021F84DFA|nr:tetratricopeptide repeat protein [Aeromonas piscicola]MCW0507449.1 hypothetical protein [Aeromonas piscicola]